MSGGNALQVDAEEIKADVDIVKVIGDRMKLRKRGLDYKGVCPFHAERTPSFNVRPSTGRWHCFGCDADGDVIDFVMRFDRITFLEAVALLAGDSPGPTSPASKRPTAVASPAHPPAVDARPLLSALWDVVRDAPWSTAAVEHLLNRGIEPDAAWAVGCRDWSSVAGAVRELLASTDLEVREAAGLARDGVPWSPLSHLANPSWAGIAVPIYSFGGTFPTRWRWRFLQRPWPDAPKSLSCFGAGGVVDFLGAAVPDGTGDLDVRLGRLGSCATLLVVEGEPDWWSAIDAVDGRAVVVAVCNGAKAWRPSWPSLRSFRARGIERVLICVHEGKPGPDGEPGHGLQLAESIATIAATCDLEVRARLPSEAEDLNDIHRAGGLRAWLDSTLSLWGHS